MLVAVALFGASGAAALIYQIVWLEQLSLAIGSSALSLGVLLATFLGGLCIGSLIASRLAWPTHALHRYAVLELAIGALGALALHAIPALGALHTAVAGTAAVGVGSRLFVAMLALLPPTILMGATLPVIALWLRRTGRGTAWLGLCYGANAGGGVVGCVLAGFYLLRVHDVYVATGVAVGLNCSWPLRRFCSRAETAPPTMPRAPLRHAARPRAGRSMRLPRCPASRRSQPRCCGRAICRCCSAALCTRLR